MESTEKTKRLSPGVYSYKGYTIQRVDNQDGGHGKEWDIVNKGGEWCDRMYSKWACIEFIDEYGV